MPTKVENSLTNINLQLDIRRRENREKNKQEINQRNKQQTNKSPILFFRIRRQNLGGREEEEERKKERETER